MTDQQRAEVLERSTVGIFIDRTHCCCPDCITDETIAAIRNTLRSLLAMEAKALEIANEAPSFGPDCLSDRSWLAREILAARTEVMGDENK